ncbi:MAG TPA: N,N-dimethylformamidase beta subunit family domain-containing protein [Acidimicrobiales bacterium]
MEVVGYFDAVTVRPGDRTRLAVSADAGTVDVSLVRLGTDEAPDRAADAPVAGSRLAGRYAVRRQDLATGSAVVVPDAPHLRVGEQLSVSFWMLPTLLAAGVQVVMAKRDATGASWAVSTTPEGHLLLEVVGADGVRGSAVTARPLDDGTWYLIGAAYDLGDRLLSLAVHRQADTIHGAVVDDAPVTRWVEGPAPASGADLPLTIAASAVPDGAGYRTTRHFNGKVARPRLYRAVLTPAELLADQGLEPRHEAVIGAWDFARDVDTRRVVDTSPHGAHGRTVQMPTRAVTGPGWDDTVTGLHDAPDRYDAIHFHDDDLDDAGWEPTVEWEVDEGLPSGIYGARIVGAGEDTVPIVVRPPDGEATAPVLFVAPVFSWLAYGNFRGFQQLEPNPSAAGRYIVDHRLNSLYDRHADGSGVAYASWLRPIVDMRPGHVMRRGTFTGGPTWGPPYGELPHQLSADLDVLRWLHHEGQAVDVVTDLDVHREGAALLQRYRVVVSGTHAEYWSAAMLDALDAYLGAGGRYLYLSGNGLYWVTGLDPEEGHTIEVRRHGAATAAWHTAPGESFLSTTGEQGGTWRWRGRAPQRLVGVGFSAEWASGLANGCAYVRTPASHDPRVAFAFEGIGDDELIGDVPNPVLAYGAAGYELDRADHRLGTPRHALVVATARPTNTEHWQAPVEEQLHPRLRADLTFFETAAGGAVFSTGSVAWAGCLAHAGYDNNVARLTGNVLRRFLDPEPFDCAPIRS